MRKMKLLIALTTGFMVVTALTSYAGTWEQDSKGWKYKDNNDQYATGWVLDNGNYYYIGNDGYMLSDTITPDGYTVNSNGEWIDSISNNDKLSKTEFNVSKATVLDITEQGRKLADEAKEAGMSIGGRTQLISVYTNQGIYGNDGIIITKNSDAYTVDIGVRLNNSINQKGLKELLRLTGYDSSELYNALYQSLESEGSPINYDTFADIAGHQIKAVNNGNSITYIIK